MLVNGKWVENWQPVQKADEQGRFVRQVSEFRNWITTDGRPGPTGEGGFEAEAGRYRLYVALICPWASRTLIARRLKGLADLIPVTVVNPTLTDQGWRFGGYPGADEDPLYASKYMHELYTRADPHVSGRATVPVLWDMKRGVMVNNESADIVRMFDTAFDAIAPGGQSWKLTHGTSGEVRSATVRHGFESNSGELIVASALGNGGMSMLPDFLVRDELAAGTLRRILKDWTPPEIWLTAFYPPYEMLPAKVEAFTGFIEEQVRAFPDRSGQGVV